MSLHDPDTYAIIEGRIVSNRGIDIPVSKFFDRFDEEHIEHSNALHGLIKGDKEPYLVGPVARYNNNYQQLSKLAKQVAKKVGLGTTCNNPFKSLLVRMVKPVYACEEALRLVQAYVEPEAPFVEATVRAGEGAGCTEAPRGICVHRYKVDGRGLVLEARIDPPTAQNQPQIERDLLGVVQKEP